MDCVNQFRQALQVAFGPLDWSPNLQRIYPDGCIRFLSGCQVRQSDPARWARIRHPAAPVKSLREKGHTTLTCRKKALKTEGRMYPRVASYVLVTLASNENSANSQDCTNGPQSQ